MIVLGWFISSPYGPAPGVDVGWGITGRVGVGKPTLATTGKYARGNDVSTVSACAHTAPTAIKAAMNRMARVMSKIVRFMSLPQYHQPCLAAPPSIQRGIGCRVDGRSGQVAQA